MSMGDYQLLGDGFGYHPGYAPTGNPSNNNPGGSNMKQPPRPNNAAMAAMMSSSAIGGSPGYGMIPPHVDRLNYRDKLATPPIVGLCHKCGEAVLSEGTGCTAMDQVYHMRCFTCSVCNRQLSGLAFYALSGKPYCESDYLNTLEKCCVCNRPILDRILRATGKPYHAECFTCTVCGKGLEGIPFTVDNVNRIHCIEDFNKKFAPRCSVCHKPIIPEPNQPNTVRVVALDRNFHVSCYKCEDCGLLLGGQAEGRGCYPLDDHILCRNCNARRVRKLTAS